MSEQPMSDDDFVAGHVLVDSSDGLPDPKHMKKAGLRAEVIRLRRENRRLTTELGNLNAYLAINRGLGLGVDKLSELVQAKTSEVAERVVAMIRSEKRSDP